MENKRQRKWHKIPGPLQALIERLADEFRSWTPTQIYNDLTKEKYPEVATYGRPDKRTVQAIIKKSRPPDPSGPWEPTEWESGKDVALVLDVVKHLGEDGGLIWPTQAEAERLRWLRQAAPTLPPTLAWRLARRYLIY
jgi:hypothetical protein